jgi:hypothetical protein
MQIRPDPIGGLPCPRCLAGNPGKTSMRLPQPIVMKLHHPDRVAATWGRWPWPRGPWRWLPLGQTTALGFRRAASCRASSLGLVLMPHDGTF